MGRFHPTKGINMKFNKETAIAVLKIMDRMPPKALLQPSAAVFGEWLDDSQIEQFAKTTNPEQVLIHLYIMSHSGLVFPPLNLKDIHDAMLQNDPNPVAGFWYKSLPKCLSQHLPTVQGYEYLEAHQ